MTVTPASLSSVVARPISSENTYTNIYYSEKFREIYLFCHLGFFICVLVKNEKKTNSTNFILTFYSYNDTKS